ISCAPTSTTPTSIRPDAIVLATAVPASAPTRFMPAASPTACNGDSTLVATTVAMELAVSWNPLMYSKTSAVMITTMTSVSIAAAPLRVLQHDLVGHPPRLSAAVDGLLQDLEELLEQEHLQVVELARVDVAVQLEHQPVGLVLDRAQLVAEFLHLVQTHLGQRADHLHHDLGRLLQ